MQINHEFLFTYGCDMYDKNGGLLRKSGVSVSGLLDKGLEVCPYISLRVQLLPASLSSLLAFPLLAR